ncbi:DNA-binding CsgD family transcriptional regulator [Bradyrhizobium elkanii]
MTPQEECPLTEREIDIVKRIAQGDTAKEVAQQIGWTHYSVNERIKTVRRIVGAKNAPHLATIALRKGWIE